MITYTYDSTDVKFYEAVYDLLVAKAGAKDDAYTKKDFVDYYTRNEHRGCEFRFCGKFGFGGKFYRNHGQVWVSYYPEDRTPKLNKLRDEITAELRDMALQYKPDLYKS